MTIYTDEYWMQQAIALARKALEYNEVPVGAIVVKDNMVIGQGFNQPISLCDPSAHAEIQALRDAAKNIDNYRLINTTLYVTLEPCAMCAGAMIHSRISRLVFGANEPKSGAVVSHTQLLSSPHINHKVSVECGVSADECAGMLSDFFAHRRKQKAKNKQQAKNLST